MCTAVPPAPRDCQGVSLSHTFMSGKKLPTQKAPPVGAMSCPVGSLYAFASA